MKTITVPNKYRGVQYLKILYWLKKNIQYIYFLNISYLLYVETNYCSEEFAHTLNIL